MHKDFLLVLSTCPDADTADRLARALLEAGLAACINVVPGLRSLYLWKGELQADAEVLLLIKTTAAKFPALREALVARHPYELPEVIAVAIEDGHHPYLAWLAEPRGPSTATDPGGTPRDASARHDGPDHRCD
jgi:periplasmic divalent cation tolerance protein